MSSLFMMIDYPPAAASLLNSKLCNCSKRSYVPSIDSLQPLCHFSPRFLPLDIPTRTSLESRNLKMSETTKAPVTSKPKKAAPSWIVNYNFISGGLWGFVLLNTLVSYFTYGQPDMFEYTNHWTILIQSLAVIEVYNAAVGNVRSPFFTTLLQVASRYLIVWGIFFLLPFSPANDHWTYVTLSVAWSVTEIIRYYYYGINIITEGNPPKILVWLRYNAFLVLYPMGISSEVAMVYLSLDEAERVYGVWYSIFFKVCMAVYVPGSYVLYTYMLKQRKKAMKALKAAPEKKEQ